MTADDFFVQHLVDSADWVADHERSLCYVCTRPFNTFRRKHHCRMCGEIVCNNCTLHKDANVDPTIGVTRVRVCISCVVSNSQPRARAPGTTTTTTTTTTTSPTARRATDASRLWMQTHLHSPSSGRSSASGDEQPLPASEPHVFALKDGHFDPEGGRRSLPDDPEAEPPLSEWLHPWPRPPVGADEDDRLQALHTLNVLDSAPEKPFDMICDLAKARLACPMAAVSFLDEHRQWFKASAGLAHKMIPRKIAFCAYTVFLREPMVVLDTLQDQRFERNPLVSGAAGVRFYAAAPIVDPTSGHVVGSVFVLDTQPRESCDIAILERLAYAAGENLPQRMEIPGEAVSNALDVELERQQGGELQQLASPERRQADGQHGAPSFDRNDLKMPTSPALSSSTASLSSVASGCYSEPASSPSKPKSPCNSSDRDADANSTAMTSLAMGKTASGEQMEVLLMRLLTQNTETQQQLAVQQISLSTKLGQHTDQINKLMSDFARMEAKVDAKVDSKAK